MDVNIPLPLACEATFLMDEGLVSISQTCCGQLVTILTKLIWIKIQGPVLEFYYFDMTHMVKSSI